MLSLSMQVLQAAIDGQHKDGGPAGWMATAARGGATERGGPATPKPAAAKGKSPGGAAGSAEKVNRGTGKHRLFALTGPDHFCQVCYKLAPAKPKQHDLATSRYKRYYCVTKGVLHDGACGLRMCAACYESHWDHDAKVLALTAKQHYRNGELPPQASGK